MGKKAKLKEMRRIARQLPEIRVQQVIGEKLTGNEVIERGVKEVDGKPVDPKNGYQGKTVIAKPLNHNRQMKKMYNRYGTRGVTGYIQSVVRHDAAVKAKAEQPAEPIHESK